MCLHIFVRKYPCESEFSTLVTMKTHPNEMDVQLDTHIALLKPISQFNVLSHAKQQ